MPRKFDAMDFFAQPSRKSTFWYFSTMIHLPSSVVYRNKKFARDMISPMGNARLPGSCQSSRINNNMKNVGRNAERAV